MELQSLIIAQCCSRHATAACAIIELQQRRTGAARRMKTAKEIDCRFFNDELT